MRFWLGTHEVAWLKRTAIPLFISHRRLGKRKTFPKALGEWALDSGGFSELSMYGEWKTSANEYVDAVAKYGEQIGRLAWAAPQDWMCEPWIVEKTGLSVEEHQWKTIESYLELKDQGPFIPVLQGWTIADYERHRYSYAMSGVSLEALPLVGVGSICRRQQTHEVAEIAKVLSGIRLHGFGVKSDGLKRYGHLLTSADSMAWSYSARKQRPGCGGRAACNNCLHYALEWREKLLGGDMPAKKKATTSTATSNGKSNLGAAARGAAMKRMIESYPEAWGEFLKEEREKVGLGAETGRKTRIQMLAAKMIEAGVERDEVNKALGEAGFKATV